MRPFLFFICLSAIAGCATTTDQSYWTRDALHWKTERTVVDVTPDAAKWCKGAWGCIHRNPVYYDWDYHRTGIARPSECVAIVDASLPDDLREAVKQHELCHCKGFTHPAEPRWFVKCPE